MVPVEMLGYVAFPAIDKTPYALTLAPYSFLWLELQAAPEVHEVPVVETEEAALDLIAGSWKDLLAASGMALIQELLPAYLVRQRWFGAKSRTIASVRVRDWAEMPGMPAALVFIEVSYADAVGAGADVYQLPLALSSGTEAEAVRVGAPGSILASLNTGDGPAILHDATAREDFRQGLLRLVEREDKVAGSGSQGATEKGEEAGDAHVIRGRRSSAFQAARGAGELAARTGSAEQSNTSILYDQRLILKLFRRLQPGENPDTEIGRFLTEVAHFPRIAPYLGEIRSGETTLGMLQGLIENEGDGWQFTQEELGRYYESVATSSTPTHVGTMPSFLREVGSDGVHDVAREHAGLYLEAAALLGRRTGEMHLALATSTEGLAADVVEAFEPERFTDAALIADADRIDAQILHTMEALKRALNTLPDEVTTDAAALILSRRLDLLRRSRAITEGRAEDAGLRTRIHGDYHLGQVLRARGDYVILDFEGEPARSLEERRAKQSPLRDVAGMLRSFSYAAYGALEHFTQRHAGTAKAMGPWAQLWQNAASTEFLNAWRTTVAVNPHLIPQAVEADRLLNAYLLEKALYELLYELNNRPAWVRIPMVGILALP
jgi:maltose alpha-D-glucosyltransferase/alpha-amylase